MENRLPSRGARRRYGLLGSCESAWFLARVDTMSPAAAPLATPETDTQTMTEPDLPWLCIVWDDPVNLMSYVTYVFETVLGYGRARATELMMKVHTEGKAVVSSGERDKVEVDVKKLQTAGLWATMQRSEG